MSFLSLIAISPFIVFIYLLLFKKTSLLKSSVITLALVLALKIDVWRVLPLAIAGSFIKGGLVATDIFMIILGAVFFLEILKRTGVVTNICHYLEGFSKDYRIQIIFLAWFFENFIEGTAGFGTPAAIVAPILIGMGLSPIAAVIISLLGNSASVVFGAAGTPIRVGFAGIATPGIPLYTALLNSIGLLVPTFMLFVATSGRKERKKEFIEALPFALWSGISFILPSIALVFFGQEFPSIIGSVVGLALVIITTKLGFLVPKNIIDPHPQDEPEVILPKFKVVFPYAFLIFLLIVGKFAIGTYGISVNLIVKHTVSLFNPGAAFIITAIPTILMFKAKTPVYDIAKLSFRRSFEPFLVILSMSVMVQLMVVSGSNSSGLPTSLNLIAGNLKTPLLPFLAPFLGAFGSFVTGSATVSNIMFGNILNTVAQDLRMNAGIILALELVGAAAGNMIALADVLAAETVVGLKGSEREVLKGVIVPCLIYVTLAGAIGLLIIG